MPALLPTVAPSKTENLLFSIAQDQKYRHYFIRYSKFTGLLRFKLCYVFKGIPTSKFMVDH